MCLSLLSAGIHMHDVRAALRYILHIILRVLESCTRNHLSRLTEQTRFSSEDNFKLRTEPPIWPFNDPVKTFSRKSNACTNTCSDPQRSIISTTNYSERRLSSHTWMKPLPFAIQAQLPLECAAMAVMRASSHDHCITGRF